MSQRPRIARATPRMYASVAPANAALKAPKNGARGPRGASCGRSSTAQSAGVSVSATKAEMVTEAARVSANCR